MPLDDTSGVPPIGPMRGDAHLLPEFSYLGKTRPLGSGEWVTNPGGSWSNEITATVQNPALNSGRHTVVPTLWLLNGTPTRVNEDHAGALASRSGLAFPSFDNSDKAEAFATTREDKWQGMKPEQSRQVPSLWSFRSGFQQGGTPQGDFIPPPGFV